MKRLLVPLVVVALLMVPAIIPVINVGTTNAPATATNSATLHVPLADVQVTISPGGEAMAWNLVYELCKMGLDDMCDLYFHGQNEGWWN